MMPNLFFYHDLDNFHKILSTNFESYVTLSLFDQFPIKVHIWNFIYLFNFFLGGSGIHPVCVQSGLFCYVEYSFLDKQVSVVTGIAVWCIIIYPFLFEGFCARLNSVR